jgi:hypothetical protein
MHGFVIGDIHGSIPKNPNGCVSFSAAANGVADKRSRFVFRRCVWSRDRAGSAQRDYWLLNAGAGFRIQSLGADTHHPEIDSGSMSGYRLFKNYSYKAKSKGLQVNKDSGIVVLLSKQQDNKNAEILSKSRFVRASGDPLESLEKVVAGIFTARPLGRASIGLCQAVQHQRCISCLSGGFFGFDDGLFNPGRPSNSERFDPLAEKKYS